MTLSKNDLPSSNMPDLNLDTQAAAAAPAQPALRVDDLPSRRHHNITENLKNADRFDPDREAAVRALSKRTGYSPAFINANLDEFQKRQALPDNKELDELRAAAPETYSLLNDKNDARLVQDDYQKMGFFERNFKQVLNAYKKASKQDDLAKLRLKQREKDLRLNSYNKDYDDEIELLSKEIEDLPAPQGSVFGRIPYVATEFAAQMLFSQPDAIGGALGGAAAGAGVGAGVGSVVPAVGTAAGAAAGAVWGSRGGYIAGLAKYANDMEGGLAYGDLRDLRDKNGNPIPVAIADKASRTVGHINAALETAGDLVFVGGVLKPVGKMAGKVGSKLMGKSLSGAIGKTLSKIPGADGLVKIIGGNPAAFEGLSLRQTFVKAAKEWAITTASEVATEYAQNAVQLTAEEAAKAASGQPFERRSVGEILAESGQGMEDVAVGAGTLGLFGFGGNFHRHFQATQEAARVGDLYRQLGEGVKELKLTERAPDKTIAFLANQTNGTKMENVYIPITAVERVAEENKIDPHEFLQAIGPDAAAQYEEAKATGGSIQVKTAVWAVQSQLYSKQTGKPVYEAFERDIKTDPDGRTLNELQAENDAIKETAEQADRLIKEGQVKETDLEQAVSLFRNRLDEFVKPEPFSDEQWEQMKDANAQLMARLSIVEAKKRGQDFAEFAEHLRLPIVQTVLSDRQQQAFEQAKAVYGKIKTALEQNEETQAAQENGGATPIIDYLLKRGGVITDGTDWAGETENWRRKESNIFGLVNNKSGVELYNAALAVQEMLQNNGWGSLIDLSDPAATTADVPDLIAAVNEEIGRYVPLTKRERYNKKLNEILNVSTNQFKTLYEKEFGEALPDRGTRALKDLHFFLLREAVKDGMMPSQSVLDEHNINAEALAPESFNFGQEVGRGLLQDINYPINQDILKKLDMVIEPVKIALRFSDKEMQDISFEDVAEAMESYFSKSNDGLYATNKETGLTAKVSKNSQEKIFSTQRKTPKSIGGKIGKEIAVHLRELYENAVLVKTHPDKNGVRSYVMHRFFVPAQIGKRFFAVKISVKEFSEKRREFSFSAYDSNGGRDFGIYDLSVPKEITPEVGRVRADNSVPLPTSEAMDSIAKKEEEFKPTLRDLLRGVSDSSGAYNRDAQGQEVFQFAGINAKTADPLQLAKAKKMLESGQDPESVRKETGWFKGADGKMRFEINDKDAEFLPSALEEFARAFAADKKFKTSYDFLQQYLNEKKQNVKKYKDGVLDDLIRMYKTDMKNAADARYRMRDSIPLGELLKHDVLFEAYPFLRDVSVEMDFSGKERLGAYYPRQNVIAVEESLFDSSGDKFNKIYPKEKRLADLKSVLMHEIQHAIQNYENFAFGTSADRVSNGEYKRSAGEIEARNTQARVNMDDKQRRDVPPANTQDIKNADAIVQFNSGTEFAYKPQAGRDFYQTAYHGTPHRFETFSVDAIGTGEGAQVHGWGLYFAQNKEVSERYRKDLQYRIKHLYDFFEGDKKLPDSVAAVLNNELSGNAMHKAAKGNSKSLKENIRLAAESYQRDTVVSALVKELQAAKESIVKNPKMSIAQFLKENTDYRYKSIVQAARSLAKKEQRRAAISDVADMLNGHLASFERLRALELEKANALAGIDVDKLVVRENRGQLFEVQIPENDALLDEQKTFSEQPEKVKNALKSLAEEHNSNLLRESIAANETGRSMYRALMADNENFLKEHNEQSSSTIIAKNASEFLLSEGIKGITYLGGRDGRGYVIFDDAAVRVLNTFYQQSAVRMRGKFNDLTNTITLTPDANASTLTHELAHYWLNERWQYLNSGLADESYKKDFLPLAEYLGIKNGQTTLTREQHEKFATSFEAYLREGKSPSLELGRLFGRLRRWLLRVYRDVKKELGVELNDKIRRVFDRMLATEEEIAAAERERMYEPFTKTPGMTEEDVQRLKKLREDAHNAAVVQIMKEEADLWREEKAQREDYLYTKEREQVEKQLSATPEYQLANIVESHFADSQYAKDNSKSAQNIATAKELAHAFHNNTFNEADRTLWNVLAENNAMTGATMAEMLVSLKPFNEAAMEETEKRMTKYNLNKDMKDLRRAQAEALSNDRALDVLALERDLFLNYKRAASVQRALETKALAKKYAREWLRGKPARLAARYTLYFTAQKNAAQRAARALAKQDYEAAAKAKMEELFNAAAAQESIRISKQLHRLQDTLKYFQRKKINTLKRQEHYLQMADILMRVGYPRNDYTPSMKMETLADWVKRYKEAGYDFVLVPDWITNEAQNLEWRNLSIDRLKEVVDTIKNINHTANFEDRLFSMHRRQTISELAFAVAQHLSKTISAKTREKYKDRVEPEQDGLGNGIEKYLYSMTKLDTLVHKADGYSDFGLMYELFIQPTKEAADKESVHLRAFKEAYQKLINAHYSTNEVQDLFNKKSYHPELGDECTKERLLVMALNMGNEINAKRLFENAPVGYRYIKNADGTDNLWNEQSVRKLMRENLTANDWDFVQGVWDLINEPWGQISEMHRKMTGFMPGKVEAVPFAIATADGKNAQLRGGYFPIKYDWRGSGRAEREEYLAQPLYTENNQAWVATTKQGHTKARAKEVHEPLALNISLVERHLTDVIHDLYFRPAVVDLRRLLNHDHMREVLTKNLGHGGYAMLKAHLNMIATGGQESSGIGIINKTVDWLRRHTTIAVLAGKTSVIVENLANPWLFVNAVEGFTAKDVLKGISLAISEYGPQSLIGMKKAKELQNFVFSKSPMMKDKSENYDITMRQLRKSNIFGEDSVLLEFTNAAMVATDDFFAIPMWMTAYNKWFDLSISEKKTEKEAEKIAIEHADMLINRVLGSGRRYDAAEIMRNRNAIVRCLTMFATFMNNEFNRWSRETGLLLEKRDAVRYAGFVAGRLLVWHTVSQLLAGKWPEDLSPEELLKWWFGGLVDNVSGMFVGIRDILPVLVSKIMGWQSFGYRPTPISGTVEEMILRPAGTVSGYVRGKRTGQDAAESVAKAVSYIAPYPGQLNTLFFNAYDYVFQGSTPRVRDLYRRRPKNERGN